MSEVTVDIEQWAEENFGNCQLGDARRTRRAVTVARQMVEFPDGSTPQQAEKWADLKAVYHLEVFCHLIEQQSDWVIRSAQLHRTVFDEAGEKTDVRRLLAAQPCLGTYDLKVRVAKGRSSRTAHMEVRAVQATIRKPKRMTPWLKSIDFEEVTQWIVEAREVNAPKGTEALHWVLWTSLPIASFAAAWTVIEYYEKRWLIEEYHKAIKTGCRLESRQ